MSNKLPIDIPGNIKALREVAETTHRDTIDHNTWGSRMAGFLDEALDICEALQASEKSLMKERRQLMHRIGEISDSARDLLCLVRLKYGNLDPDANKIQGKAAEVLTGGIEIDIESIDRIKTSEINTLVKENRDLIDRCEKDEGLTRSFMEERRK